MIVGVGASAGGLEALEGLFEHVKPDTGICYVVVQHLSPDFKSMMVELLTRHTDLRVVEIEDGSSPQQDCIHLIPPKSMVTLEGGAFRLVDRESARLAFPINLFLSSLAEHQGDHCAAVILSGTGTDGTHGARLIKESGGLVVVQEPASAKFDGMPNSVISAGLADFVATTARLAERLSEYAAQPIATFLEGGGGDLSSERDAYAEIVKLLRRQSRIDFGVYREGTISRRLQRRAALSGESSLHSYLRTLRSNDGELELLTRELLIGVTQFFRDPAAWQVLEESVIPMLIDQVKDRGTLRIWCTGCATGEEAYSLAIAIEEHLHRERRTINYRLFATDVRRDSLRFARAGVYPLAGCMGMSESIRETYFDVRGESLVAKRSLRDVITFAPHDVLSDPPFTQLHLVTCRNLLIYLLPEVQQRVIARFRMALREGGCLFLGASESVGEAGSHFTPINAKFNMFQARGPVSGIATLATPLRDHVAADPEEAVPVRSQRTSEQLYEAALRQYVPPGVAVDANFELLQVFGKVPDYVSLPAGRMTINLLKMVPRPLAVLLSAAGRRALTQGEEVRIPEVRLQDGREPLTVRVIPVEDMPGAAACLMVFFEGAPITATAVCLDPGALDAAAQQRMKELEDELLVARENLHSAVQDLEATNEELQATNEELTASNEELQSTNEELQSVNEELYTVNSEYQEKIAELEQLNSDLENLLRVVEAGVLFLDDDLSIRRFNDAATRILPLRHEDVGRPLTEIAIQADYPGFARDAERVMSTGDRQFTTVRGNDGAWWSIGMRPFRNASTPSGGVIVTMQEVSELKRTISRLEVAKHEHEKAEAIFGVGHAVLDVHRETVQYSPGALALLGLPGQDRQVVPLTDDQPLSAEEEKLISEGLRVVHSGSGAPVTLVRDVARPDGQTEKLQVTIYASRELTEAGRLFVVFQPAPES